MNDLEVRAAVTKIIEENNLDAQIVSCECEHDDTQLTVRVEVDRKDFNRAIMLDGYFDTYSIRWQQKTPALVGAEVGDLVLIYSDHCADDNDSDIGLVSSKFTEENGDVCYGCRYIKIGLNDRFINSLYDFELTTENYGGFPVGFLKVLTPQEAQDFLSKQLDAALKNELAAAQDKYDRSTKNLGSLIENLGKTKRIKCEKIELQEGSFILSLKQ